MSLVAAVLPVQRIPKEALFPHHGGHSTGQEVGVVLGPIANKVAESQLPRLQSKEDKMVSQSHIKENYWKDQIRHPACNSILLPMQPPDIHTHREKIGFWCHNRDKMTTFPPSHTNDTTQPAKSIFE